MDTDQEKRSDFAAIVSGTPNPTSAHEAARFIATVSLSLGALMLSLFGIIDHMAVDRLRNATRSSICAPAPALVRRGAPDDSAIHVTYVATRWQRSVRSLQGPLFLPKFCRKVSSNSRRPPT